MKHARILATLLMTIVGALSAIAQSDETAKRFHVFPQLADGGGWQSFLLVTNVTQSSSFCTFELHGLSLDRFHEVSGITASGSTATFSLDGSGGYLVWPTKNESALASGYATLDCTAPTVVQVLYASRDGSGVTGMATVFSSQAGTVFQFPVLTPEAKLGIAIANDTNTEASCRFVLESPEQENLGHATLQISSKSNLAKFLYEVIPIPGGFTSGLATVSCDQQVSVIGYQFAGAIFTTLPPAILDTSPQNLAISERDALAAFYHATGGDNWTRNDNWLTDRPIQEWYGVSRKWDGGIGISLHCADFVDAVGGGKNCNGNNLTGSIPPEIGSLHLAELELCCDNLTGPIPPELGRLTESPSSWGTAYLNLFLGGNDLSGPIPPELGALAHLSNLDLSRNKRLSGALPASLIRLTRLRDFGAEDTGLCVSDARVQNWLSGIPRHSRLPLCSGVEVPLCDGDVEGPLVYLTQAVQSPQYPVPLVAGEEALLRVFVTAPDVGGATMPPVRARFFVDEQETQLDIPAGNAPIPAKVEEGSLACSVNYRVPAEVVKPGLELVVEVDPDGLGPLRRIPEIGRLPVDVRTMPVFDLTVIPFIWSSDPETSIVERVEAMVTPPTEPCDPRIVSGRYIERDASQLDGRNTYWNTYWGGGFRGFQGDPAGQLLCDARTLLPIGDLQATAHEPVEVSDPEDTGDYHETRMELLRALLSATEVIRAMEGGSGHYMGTVSAPRRYGAGIGGIANLGGKASIADTSEDTIAHELGHNLNLGHAPCGTDGFLDPLYPYNDGSIGAWGYRFGANRLVSPYTPDLMGYCDPYSISDYHFTKALNYRLSEEASTAALPPQAAASVPSLLLWGGLDASGIPFLEPVFVVDSPVSAPSSTGDHRISGFAEDGRELFSLAFAMPELGDGRSSSFAFTVPVGPGWAEELADVTLSGPGGAATLDEDTNRPVTILRNPQTGQVRGILRGAQAAASPGDDTAQVLALVPDAEEYALPPDADVEALTSRGLPDLEDWR